MHAHANIPEMSIIQRHMYICISFILVNKFQHTLLDSVKPHITSAQTTITSMEWEGEGALLINTNKLFHLEIEDLGISNAKSSLSHFSFKLTSHITHGRLKIIPPSFPSPCPEQTYPFLLKETEAQESLPKVTRPVSGRADRWPHF